MTPVRYSPRPVTALPAYLSPRAGSGTRRVMRRLVRSASLRDSIAAAFYPLAIGLGFILAVLIGTSDSYVTWAGFHPIPTGAGQ